MTNIQNDTYSTLWRIVSDLDDTHSKLEYLLDLLQIYDEHLDREMDFVSKQHDTTAYYLNGRYSLLRSMMDVMRFYLGDVIDTMQLQIDAVYDEGRKAKA